MLATLMPLFSDNMEVNAYTIFAQKSDSYMDAVTQSTSAFDGAGVITGLEIVNKIGLETLSQDHMVFIEINNISIFSDIAGQCFAAHDRVVLLIDPSIKPEDMYVNRMNEILEAGFKFAMRKLKPADFENYRPVLEKCSYIFLDHKNIDIDMAHKYFTHMYKDMKLCAVNVDTREEYEELSGKAGYDLYEGLFFRTPITKSQRELVPFKVTYLQLLNVVNETDFEITDAANVIGQDAALVVRLLEMVNHMTSNRGVSSVRHAAALLGQNELKKWITTVITKELCSDRPSEIMRMSMIRARFAENLSKYFELEPFSAEIFLMGLFSVLDQILEKPMKECLEMVKISTDIRQALLDHKGRIYPVLEFILHYEDADWADVSRIMLLNKMRKNQAYDAYLEALDWHRKIITIK